MNKRREFGNDNGKVSLQRLFSQHRSKALEIENFISDELARCSGTRPDQMLQRSRSKRDYNHIEVQKLRTAVCSSALDKLLEIQPAICDLITEIRSEYQKFISVLSQGQFQFNFLRDEITKSLTDPLSIILLQKRKEQLKQRIAILTENNERLNKQISNMAETPELNRKASRQKENEKDSKDAMGKVERLQPELEPGNTNSKSHSVLKQMPLSSATDLGQLLAYSAELQTKILKLKSSLKSQYANKEFLQDLRSQLTKKENTQYHLQLHNSRLRERFENLRSATEPLQGVICASQQPQTMSSLVNKALENHRKPDKFAVEYLETAGVLDDDDPAKTREAEELIEYVDVFNEMISSKQYEQAAKHAASSPKGILRSYDTIKTFRQIDGSMNSGEPSELMFCKALMVTAKNTDNMSPGLSCEIIRCALKNQRLDLVSHWLCKNCLTYSLPMANLLMENCSCKTSCKCGSVDLAKDIYANLNAHRQAALCLLSAGKIHQMIQYGEDHQFTSNDYIFLCRRFPSTKLFLLLMSAYSADKAEELVSFPMVVNILVESNNITVLKEILQEIYTNHLTSKDGRVRTLKELMLAETASDDMSRSKWDIVVEICSKNSLNDIAIELLSILTVREAMDNAAYKYLLDYIS